MVEDNRKEIAEGGKYEKKLESKAQKLWSLFTTLLTVAFAAFAIYCVLGTMNQSKTGQMFFPLGYRPVAILSGSMEETLATGGVVIVKQTKDVAEDDIIFFISEENSLVIHRYIDTDENGDMITKGDNNPKEDLVPVTEERLLGKVVYVMNWMSVPMNFMARLIATLF